MPFSVANQGLSQSGQLSAAGLAEVVKHAPLPVSGLRKLEISEAFRFDDMRNIAKYLAEVFPCVEFTLCPHRKQYQLAACASTIMDLKKGYSRVH